MKKKLYINDYSLAHLTLILYEILIVVKGQITTSVFCKVV